MNKKLIHENDQKIIKFKISKIFQATVKQFFPKNILESSFLLLFPLLRMTNVRPTMRMWMP